MIEILIKQESIDIMIVVRTGRFEIFDHDEFSVILKQRKSLTEGNIVETHFYHFYLMCVSFKGVKNIKSPPIDGSRVDVKV